MDLLSSRLTRLYHGLVRVFFAVCAVCLFVSCLVCTNFLDLEERSHLTADNVLLQAALLLILGALCIFAPRPKGGADKLYTALRWVLVGIGGALGLLWVTSTRFIPYSDASLTLHVTQNLILQDYTDVMPGGYLAAYPHQSGLVIFHWVLIWLFGERSPLAFQYLNVGAYVGILILLGALARDIGLGKLGQLLSTLLGLMMLPLVLYTTFVYGTLLGLFCAMLGLRCALRVSMHWVYGIFCLGFLAASIVFKSNYQIFAIGCLLYILVTGLLKKQPRIFVLAAGLILVILFSARVPVLILERKTGYDLHSGCTALSWVVMGLGNSSDKGPGWWDNYNMESYLAAGMDPNVQKQQAMIDLRETLSRFTPGSALSFFAQKTATQWSDPLYESVWLNRGMLGYTAQKVPGSAWPAWVTALLSDRGDRTLALLLDPLQTILCCGFVLFALLPGSHKKEEGDLPSVILVGGFLFHLVWEAKGQYTLPYMVLAIPLAVEGWRKLRALRKS